ncbi:MAG: hypothetical protein GY756_00285, partial [bacterium]|nr:hypothetical protein [bacterium]
MRIDNRISPEGQKAETLWVNYLYDNGIKVSKTIETKNKKLVEQINIKDTAFSAKKKKK